MKVIASVFQNLLLITEIDLKIIYNDAITLNQQIILSYFWLDLLTIVKKMNNNFCLKFSYFSWKTIEP